MTNPAVFFIKLLREIEEFGVNSFVFFTSSMTCIFDSINVSLDNLYLVTACTEKKHWLLFAFVCLFSNLFLVSVSGGCRWCAFRSSSRGDCQRQAFHSSLCIQPIFYSSIFHFVRQQFMESNNRANQG